MAVGLVALQACNDEERVARPNNTPTTPPGTTAPPLSPSTTLGAGGTLTVPAEATLDTELATTTTHVPAGTLLIDVQNHLLDYVMHPDAEDFTGFPQAG